MGTLMNVAIGSLIGYLAMLAFQESNWVHGLFAGLAVFVLIAFQSGCGGGGGNIIC